MNCFRLFSIACLLLLIACQDEKIGELDDTDKSLALVPRMNDFTERKMKSVYLWADRVSSRKVSLELPPIEFFNKLVYHEEDPWSYIDNNNSGTGANIEGYDDQFGYDLQFYSGLDQLFAQVCYVYPNTPAARAGLKRGDIILKNNGEYLTYSNLNELNTAEHVEIELAEIVENTLFLRDHKIKLRATKTDVNPVLLDTVLNYYGHKIGYLHYTEFADNQENSLKTLSITTDNLKQAGIQSLILDLRYNQGGYLTAARHLCSLIAPQSVIENESLLISKHWNEEYQKKYAGSKNMLEERFDKGVAAHNLNLQHLYVITSQRTASASELVISGLKPYLKSITLIGSTTRGKYVASTAFQPNDNELHNWVLHPIVFAYKNAGNESVKGGLPAQIEIKEAPQTMLPLGDIREPLLRAALNTITNRPQETEATTRGENRFTPIESATDKRRSLLLVPAQL